MRLSRKWVMRSLLAVAIITALCFIYIMNRSEPAQLNILPPGSALPSAAACAARVTRSSWEPRPTNGTTNNTVPTPQQIASLQPWDPHIGMSDQSDIFRRRVTGNYTGTTDEILQWAACKWGIEPDLVRAQAEQESNWQQSMRGDWTRNQSQCPPGTWRGTGCYQSYGIMQMKYSSMPSAWPISHDSTAFNLDFTYGWIRNCYEGGASYLYTRTPQLGYPSYHAGDIKGCLGFWYSGNWYDQLAIDYIQRVMDHYAKREWRSILF